MDEGYREYLCKKIKSIITEYNTMDEWTKKDYIFDYVSQLIKGEEESE